jgi:hypothetical protein
MAHARGLRRKISRSHVPFSGHATARRVTKGHSTWPQLEHRASFHAADESAKAVGEISIFYRTDKVAPHPGRVAKGMLHGIDLSDPRDD